MHRYIVLSLLIFVATISSGFSLENQTNVEANSTQKPPETPERHARVGPANLLTCYVAKDVSCFLEVGEQFLEQKRNDLLVQEQSEARASGENPRDLNNAIARVFNEITAVFKENFLGFFRTAKEDDQDIENKADHVGEARKKKKKGKIIGLIKLLILGAVLKAIITLKLNAISVALQVKFLLIALAGLGINAVRFYLDLKKGHNPQKVIYYEHAQHQHHYDGAEEDWGGSSPGGGYWGRSYDEEPQNLAYAKQKPTTNKSWLA